MTDAGVVIVGTGQGGFQVAASLRKEGYEDPVTLVGEEPGLPYQRPPLSKEYMTGEAGPEKVYLRPEAFYAKQGIDLQPGERLERIDRTGRQVELASGRRLPYGHLVVALGARPRLLPVPGGDLDGVHVLRTLADAEVLRKCLDEAEHVVVIGGGFIGLEFAAAACTRGVGVTVVEALDRPMARVVSPEISRYYTGRHEEAGAQVLLGTGVERLEGQGGKVTAVRTADGRRLPADLVVVGVGVVPNTEPGEAAGLVVDNGILVDEHLTTSDPLISAVGDCAAYPSCHAGRRVRLESVQNAVDHGRCVAARLAGRPAPYTSVPWFWSDQHGCKLQIAGLTAGREHAVVRGDVEAGAFSVFCFYGDRLAGVESVNRPADHMAARRLLAGEPAVTPEQAADPSFDLKAHANAAARRRPAPPNDGLSCNVTAARASIPGRSERHMPTSNGELRAAPATFALPDWPRHAWYAAAYDVELKNELLPRTVAGRRLVMFRRSDGRPVALENACWHRLLPLHKGHIEGDEVVCGYHGLVYDAEGRCTFMPSQKTVNPAARVRAFPIVERHRFAWVWTGDPALADPELIPDLHWNDDPGWAGDGKLIDVRCNYKLVVDNLMDLTHETFVHGSSIGHKAVAEAPFEVTHGTNSATVTRWMIDVEPPPFWAQQLQWKTGHEPGNVDRWQIIHFQAPSTIAIDVGVAPHGTGAPEGDRSEGVNGYVLNTMTPATEDSTLYFWAFCRNYSLDDQRITTLLREGVSGVFAEDEDILDAQQRAVNEHPDKEFYNLNLDGGAMWARRLIDKMIAGESEDARYAEAAREADAALAASSAPTGA